jgi:hypothetical protein
MKKSLGLLMALFLMASLAGCGGSSGGNDGGPDKSGGKDITIVEGPYKLVIKIIGNGQVKTTKLDPYNGFTCYELEAVPDKGYHFLHWEGDDYSGTMNPVDETLNKNITETAVFVDPLHFVVGIWDCYDKAEFTLVFKEDMTFICKHNDNSTASGTWYLDNDGDYINIIFNNAYNAHYNGTINFDKRKIINGSYFSDLGSGYWNATRRD